MAAMAVSKFGGERKRSKEDAREARKRSCLGSWPSPWSKRKASATALRVVEVPPATAPTQDSSCSSSVRECHMEDMIMDDLLLYILGCGLLSLRDLHPVSLVCRRWRAVAGEPYLHRKLMSGRVYSFGQNKRGCLGQGNSLQTEQLKPRPIRGLAGLGEVVSVAAGDLHTLVLTRTGKVYSFGCGLFGKLGHGFGQCEFFPRHVSTLQGQHIVKIAAGPQHSIALNSQGKVFTFGCGRHGRLGHGDELCEFLPRKLSLPVLDCVSVVDIVAGGKQTFLISDQGRVYSFGYGWYGALGHGAQLSINRPQLIEGLVGHHVVAVAAGGYHTLALTKEGKVFAFGSGFYGQLGILEIRGKKEKYSLTPVLVHAFDSATSKRRAKAIGAGDHHSVVLTDDGKVFTFGAGGSGRLGLGAEEDNQFEPRCVESLRGVAVAQISVGRSHVLLVSSQSQVYSFGSGCYGKLGHGDQVMRDSAARVDCLAHARVKAVFAGGNASFVLT